MNNVFVTLFDSGYLSRGLTLYESIVEVCEDFRLYIIAFDNDAYEKLLECELKNTIIISLEKFEDDELLSVKDLRSRGEYCWTSTPKSILYVFDNYGEDICTYIDSDIFFLSDPSCLIDEMTERDDVLITDHRYSDYCNQTETSGKYCVQFMPFKNNANGRKILEWWKDRCLENCGHDLEKGICGDQKYLDDWPERFTGVHELENIGGGVAPWNVSQYSFFEENDIIKLKDNSRETVEKMVFYHMHNLVFYDKDVVKLTAGMYLIPDTALAYVYKYYFRKHNAVCEKYKLEDKKKWINEQHFRDDNNHLVKEKNYYLFSIFL